MLNLGTQCDSFESWWDQIKIVLLKYECWTGLDTAGMDEWPQKREAEKG